MAGFNTGSTLGTDASASSNSISRWRFCFGFDILRRVASLFVRHQEVPSLTPPLLWAQITWYVTCICTNQRETADRALANCSLQSTGAPSKEKTFRSRNLHKIEHCFFLCFVENSYRSKNFPNPVPPGRGLCGRYPDRLRRLLGCLSCSKCGSAT